MSPNTPSKQHHNLRPRLTYLGNYINEIGDDGKATGGLIPDSGQREVFSRDGRRYERQTSGALIRVR